MALNKFTERKLEWSMAIISLLFGIWLGMPFESLSSEVYDDVTFFVSETAWAWFYALSGLGHIVALHINGRAWWTPFVRLVVVFLGSQVLIAMGISVLSHNGHSAAGVFYSLVGLVAYGFCIMAAGFDCGRELKIREARNANR